MKSIQACIRVGCSVYAKTMSLSKAFSMVVIATLLIGVGALTPLSAPNYDHGVYSVAADVHQLGNSDENNLSPKHKHSNHSGGCHTLACASGAMFVMNTLLFNHETGRNVPLVSVAFFQGQPTPPYERPPKLIV